MPEGPLGGPRPFASSKLEVNIFYDDEITSSFTSMVEMELKGSEEFSIESVSGPFGQLNNVVSIGMSTNQITLEKLKKMEELGNSFRDKSVDSIEVIG